jgi:hypothetical protein
VVPQTAAGTHYALNGSLNDMNNAGISVSLCYSKEWLRDNLRNICVESSAKEIK